MPTPPTIQELVQRFTEHSAAYHAGKYNETQLRREFLDPFFEALGWDVSNRQGYAEAYKDVIHEDAIKVSGATKAPDYAFRIGGTRKFFVEAKKPAVNLKDNANPAYQLRRYAWSAKLPLSILSDFEEMAVYDCRSKPDKSDKASTGRIQYYTYTDYLDKWDEIAAVFGREAVLKGSFDQFAETARGKHGTAEVDDAFLAEIEHWRDLLAHNIALRNPHISPRELNYAVQMTIDRIIFLRICEDRAIEPYGQLQELLKGNGVYPRLVSLFQRADQRYNSGLFHFNTERGQVDNPDTLTPGLTLDDKPFKDILGGLYYPDSPYEFSVLPADILGQVYEQFLGKLIRLTDGHRAVIDDKPEVKKAGGVFYTPTYIVDYIVRNTLGKMLQGRSPAAPGEPLRVLDPACGSGSFLLGAYQYLLDWYRDRYIDEGAQKWAKGNNAALYQAEDGEWKLTTAERKRILLTHIFGVDIDPQAVEVTKLSLLLKVLEGENERSLAQQLSLWQERALPDLSRNIQCGNSLISPDFYQSQQLSLLADEEQYRINAFDWQNAFPQVFQDGGFDVVIGNPPYVRQESLTDYKSYFQSHYQVYHGTADLYAYFIEKGVSLLRTDGMFAYIVANKWMRANYGLALRRWLKQQCVEEITDFGDLRVFETATTYPCILRIAKKPLQAEVAVTQVKTLDFTNLEKYTAENHYLLNLTRLDDSGWSLANEESQDLLGKINAAGIPLEEYTHGIIYRGVVTGLNEAFVIDSATHQKLIDEDARSAEIIKPFLAGRDVKRYCPQSSDRFLIFTKRGIHIKEYPAILRYLTQYKDRLMPKPKNWKGEWKGRKPGSYQWYEIQDAIDYYAEFEKPKIIYPNICKRPEFTFNESGLYTNQKCFIIPVDDKYLLGILNSSVVFFLFRSLLPKLRGDFYEPGYVFLKDFPIHPINFSDPAEVKQHNQMVALVERMLSLQARLTSANTPNDKTMLQRQIETVDHEIDALVYRLYALTDEEIQIVEGK